MKQMSECKIIPAILSASAEDMLKKIASVEGLANRIQIDIVGKAFSQKETISLESIEEVASALVLDVQLMVKEPVEYLTRCDWVGADRVFGQIEQMASQQDFIEQAFVAGMQVGLAVDLETPVSMVEKSLSQLDALLLMAVQAGRSGQKFDKRVIEKIRKVRKLSPELAVCIDGGLNPKTISACIEAGASEFAVGSFLWESNDIEGAYRSLMEVAG